MWVGVICKLKCGDSVQQYNVQIKPKKLSVHLSRGFLQCNWGFLCWLLRIEHWVDRAIHRCRLHILSGLLGADSATSHRWIKDPAKQHQDKVDGDTSHSYEEHSQADLVVVVHPAVATTTTTVKLPVHTTGVKDDSKEDWSRNRPKRSPEDRLHSQGQGPLLFSHSSVLDRR